MEEEHLFDSDPPQPVVIDLDDPEHFDNTVAFPPITPTIRDTAREMQCRLSTSPPIKTPYHALKRK
jgi:hypothetical protein